MVLVWAWDLVASPLMLPNSTEEVVVVVEAEEEEEWATWALVEVTSSSIVFVKLLNKRHQ